MKKAIYVILIVICLGVFAFGAYQLYTQYMMYSDAREEYQGLTDYKHDRDIDFDKLRKINEDIVAWIEVPNTIIDYPVVKSTNNIHYLNTTFSGESSAVGAIFIDSQNSADFSDNNTIIYGHNMKDGSMFGDLNKFQDQNYYNEHKKIYIYVPGKTYECEIFSAYVTKDGSETYMIPNDIDLSGYINYAQKQSNISTQVKNINKVITLSTCHSSDDEARMVIHASAKEI